MIEKSLQGARLARVLEESCDLPGPEVFTYFGHDEEPYAIRSEHLSDALSKVCGDEVTPKALRTWSGTHAAFLAALNSVDELRISDMATAAAERLHNTPSIARNSYVHPEVIKLADLDAGKRKKRLARLSDNGASEMRKGEAALLDFLNEETPAGEDAGVSS